MSLTKVTYSMIYQAPINVLDFGAIGNGINDDAPAIQLAINAAAIESVQGKPTTVFFPSGTYLCKSTLIFAPFVNYVGNRATTTNNTDPTNSDNKGSVLYADVSLYTNAPTGQGVLVYIETGDITISNLTFCGTTGMNANPSVGIQWSSSGGTRPHENGVTSSYTSGALISCCEMVAFSIAHEMFASAGHMDTMQMESCLTTILSSSNPNSTNGNNWGISNTTIDTTVQGISLGNPNTNLFYLTNTFLAGIPVAYAISTFGVIAVGDIPIEFQMTNGQFANFTYTGGKALDIRTTTDSHMTSMTFNNVEFLASNRINFIALGTGGTSAKKNIIFNACVLDTETDINNVWGTQFTGNLISQTINIATSGSYTSIVGNRFNNITGAPITLPSNSAYCVIANNVFEGCSTLPSISFSSTNTALNYSGNTGIANLNKFISASTACTGAVTATVVFDVTSDGTTATLHLPSTLSATTAVSNFVYGDAVPGCWRPGVPSVGHCWLAANNVGLAAPGIVTIDANGIITVYLDGTQTTTWPVSANPGGLNYSNTITYTL